MAGPPWRCLIRDDMTGATWVANGLMWPVYLAITTLVEIGPMVTLPVATKVSLASEMAKTC